MDALRSGWPHRPLLALWSSVSGVSLIAFIALIALRSCIAFDIYWHWIFKAAVVCPTYYSVIGNGRSKNRPLWSSWTLNQFCPADVYVKLTDAVDVDFLHYKTTSLAASATAKLSMRCTPTTFPPTNFTRMSSVTEPFAGKAKVSACVSGR